MTHGSYNVVQRILGMNVQFEVSSVAPRGFTSQDWYQLPNNMWENLLCFILKIGIKM